MICNSGGAYGSDTIFEQECIKNKIDVVAWSFSNHNIHSKYKKSLSIEELNEGFEHVNIANNVLK